MERKQLVVFDLDGTLVDNPEFYRTVYSGTLNAVVEKYRGKKGLHLLNTSRENYAGKGELALIALNIPFAAWQKAIEKKLGRKAINLIQPKPNLVTAMRKLEATKVVYTGSSIGVAWSILVRLGFSPLDDFSSVIGWRKGERFPSKWTMSSMIFEWIARKHTPPEEREIQWRYWSVGDDFENDLFPAARRGWLTAGIREPMRKKAVLVSHQRIVIQCPDVWFPTIEQFLKYISEEKVNHE
ncbi:MAG: hypothetical protein HY001_00435 [Candidatus Portnoybacteria bacterium]|nr:hypothetical protein [Candidatus Portnoybacteria bacterium]